MKKILVAIIVLALAGIIYFVVSYFLISNQSQITKTTLENLSAQPNFFKGVTPAQKRALYSLNATSAPQKTTSSSSEQNILDSLQAK